MVGLDGLEGHSQPRWFYDSVILKVEQQHFIEMSWQSPGIHWRLQLLQVDPREVSPSSINLTISVSASLFCFCISLGFCLTVSSSALLAANLMCNWGWKAAEISVCFINQKPTRLHTKSEDNYCSCCSSALSLVWEGARWQGELWAGRTWLCRGIRVTECKISPWQ